ncbi:MAG TPA: hypothetical protein VK821_01955 [Dehalococcoidia bacterium]|nr:hypothetical protein [Dehalococcoidia bacterium]
MDKTAVPVRERQPDAPLARMLRLRILNEIGLGVLALGAALVVIMPVFFLVSLVYDQWGIFALLATTVITGVALLFYQARIRPRLR